MEGGAVKTKCLPYRFWVNLIKKEEPFTFVRYGDGELNAIFWVSRKKGGGRTRNGDGHTLRNKQMRKQLVKSIQQPGLAPNYYRSVWMSKDCRPMERLARDHLASITPKGMVWYNALAIHFKNISGQSHAYFQAMRNLKMPIVIIGGKHLRTLGKAGCFDYHGFVEIPGKNAYHACDRIIDEALAFPSPCFYSIHAGPPSPVFAWLLWRERGNECIIADLGSILDGYGHPRLGGKGGGRLTRTFWRKRATPAILRRNLTGK